MCKMDGEDRVHLRPTGIQRGRIAQRLPLPDRSLSELSPRMTAAPMGLMEIEGRDTSTPYDSHILLVIQRGRVDRWGN